jgi:hypothetical protein
MMLNDKGLLSREVMGIKAVVFTAPTFSQARSCNTYGLIRGKGGIELLITEITYKT